VYLCGWEVGREEERMWESGGGEGGIVPLAVAIADEVVRESKRDAPQRREGAAKFLPDSFVDQSRGERNGTTSRQPVKQSQVFQKLFELGTRNVAILSDATRWISPCGGMSTNPILDR
jgi:hypothetical protein